VHEITVQTGRKTQLLDVTERIAELVRGLDGSLVTLFVPHTTAGIVLQAAGEGASAVAADVEAALDRIVDESWSWQHVHEGDANPWSHVRTALTASSSRFPSRRGASRSVGTRLSSSPSSTARASARSASS
jgi:secondary thiamine-phosphate synthase enzyme